MKRQLSERLLRTGSDQPMAERLPLRAGPLTLEYGEGSLRYIRLGDREVIRSIYCAIRDANWGTVAHQISEFQHEHGDDWFRIQFECSNRQGPVDFFWRATILGGADGQISFRMDGRVRRTFWKNRIGFCVLHPMRECAGAPCRVQHADGTTTRQAFPEYIAAENPFRQIVSMAHQVTERTWAELHFDGDAFEMEDQRNWTDASFKTFCTPLDRPFPVEVRAGEEIAQTVTLKIVQPAGAAAVADSGTRAPWLEFAAESAATLPYLGVQCTPRLEPLDEISSLRLRRLALAHLRVDLELWTAGWSRQLEAAQRQSALIDAPLEIALHCSEEARPELERFVSLIAARRPRVARWLIFQQDRWSTEQRVAQWAQKILRSYDDSIPLGAGSKANFLELNRQRPPVEALDFVVYSIQPQEHAYDCASLVETLAAQAATVTSARQFAGKLPIVISPVTLRKRVNPYATGQEAPAPPGELPGTVDPRQMSLFGAAWTLGSVKYLAESGVESVTYYETQGWRGIQETPEGSPLPAKFPSLPGTVFPVYHVLRELGKCPRAAVVPVTSSDPLLVDALAVRAGDGLRVMVANLSPGDLDVELPLDARQVRLRTLDETNALGAMQDPEQFGKQTPARMAIRAKSCCLKLKPFACAWLEVVC